MTQLVRLTFQEFEGDLICPHWIAFIHFLDKIHKNDGRVVKVLDDRNYGTFDVQIRDLNGDSYFAFLNVEQKKITLEIYAESDNERHLQLNYSDLHSIQCESQSGNFILYGLKLEKHSTSNLMSGDFERAFIQVNISADTLIVVNDSFSEGKAEVESIYIESELLETWIGTTTTQQNLPRLPREELNKNTKEFLVKIEDIGELSVDYQISYGGLDKFVVGMAFPPRLNLSFHKKKTFQQTIGILEKLVSLMSFLIGQDFQCSTKLNLTHSRKGFIVRTEKIVNPISYKTITYPLLHNNIHGSYTQLPPLDLQIFDRFFQLEEKYQNAWMKYQIYKKMESIEERYLGYFRLVEALTFMREDCLDPVKLKAYSKENSLKLSEIFGVRHQEMKSFLRYIEQRVNPYKFDVKRRLCSLFKKLPKEFTELSKFGLQDIERITTLRNKITHAEPHNISEKDMADFLMFLETLLIFAMFEKLGIEYEVSFYALVRSASIHRITKTKGC